MAYARAVKVVWDEAKNRSNLRKHGVTFQEAAELLDSHDARLDIFDEDHSEHEGRFISIGPIRRGLVLVVWTERSEEQFRIISPQSSDTRASTRQID